ncbi:nuclear autoantigenic sperm protein isoform X1 [Trematomus bernacchii]|uniref:nuclear autoantigenic sperm protein isoform X1 n=1 Tax=Trematomus bernacchii TaxID=40690 RepID=UPI00146CB2CB|nr:nuclear autoantigenic sperm protein isoform X1 [Trematomus bernacchii]
MPEETSAASCYGSAEEKPCSSSSAAAAADSSVDVAEEAKKLIGTGNRHLVMGDVVSAVSVFQDACSMLAAKYGDTAEECGEAFFLCGKSLLELARMENSVLGNALEGVPAESEEEDQPNGSNIESANNLDEETRDDLRKQVYDAMAEKAEPGDIELESEEGKGTPEVKKENGVVNGSSSPVSEKEKSSVQKVNGVEKSPGAPVNGVAERSTAANGVKDSGEQNDKKTNGKPEEEDNGESKPEDEQDEEESEDDDDDDDDDGEQNGQEEEEVGNLQLAWEMLEVAKVIYKKKEGKDDQLMAAQTYLKLGEVSAESGNYPQALDDFQECLALQLKHLPPHSRLLAETHYHVATTLCYMDQYSQAIQHYNSSVDVIETRLAMLQEAIDAAGGAAEEKNEMDELKQLLPDIKEKVEDAKESQRTGSAASQAIQQTLGGASTSSSAFSCENGGPSSSSASAFATVNKIPVKSSGSASSSKAVSNISHLVRKKRKPEEESPVKDTDAKQAKQEATVNGSGDSSASNGKGVQEGKSQEPASSSAAVGSSA